MRTPMERRLEEATRKAIAKAKANGTYKPPTPAYKVPDISEHQAWRMRRIGFRG